MNVWSLFLLGRLQFVIITITLMIFIVTPPNEFYESVVLRICFSV